MRNSADTDIELIQRALDGDGGQFKVIGGVAAAAVLGTFNPITGLIMAAWTLSSCWQGATEKGKSLTAILDGELLHALDGDDFKQYSRQIGYAKTREEIEKAIQLKLPLTKAAWEFKRSLPPHIEGRAFSTEITPPPTPGIVDMSAQENTTIPATDSTTDIAYVPLVQPDWLIQQNLFVLGLGGSGKGLLVSNLIRSLPKNVKIFVIDPKGDSRESGYWSEFEHRSLDSINRNPSEIIQWLDSCLDEYLVFTRKAEANGDRTLLVLDELTVLGAASKSQKYTRIGELITQITSLGDSLGRKIWLLGQSPFSGSQGFNLTQLSQLSWIVLLRKGQNLSQWKMSQSVPPLDSRTLDELVNGSPVNRAIAIQGKWRAMPRLPNYSKLDRDERDKGDKGFTDAREVFEAIKDEPVVATWRGRLKSGDTNWMDGLTGETREKVNRFVKPFI